LVDFCETHCMILECYACAGPRVHETPGWF
jgi:hypothetical protein